MIKLKVHQSLYEDSRESWVWIPKGKIKDIKSGDLIKIIYKNKSIILTVRITDSNYIKKRNINNSEININETIFLSQHYRDKLNLVDKVTYDFKIKKLVFWEIFYCKYFIYHPRAEVRLTYYLSLISIAIGIISILPFKSIYCLIQNLILS